jgi:hypothetical protein
MTTIDEQFCKTCSRPLIKKSDESISAFNRRRYCNAECRNERSRRPENVCSACGDTFCPSPWQLRVYYGQCPACRRARTRERIAQKRKLVGYGVELLISAANDEGVTTRFWGNIKRDDEGNKCWEWKGRVNDYGYGTLSFAGTTVLAHRLSYVIENDDIPNNLYILHRCDNPPCCRPDHLFLGTQSDNILDSVAKGRHVGFETKGVST